MINVLLIILELIYYLFYYIYQKFIIFQKLNQNNNLNKLKNNVLESLKKSLINIDSKISIIIPLYNEEKDIDKVIYQAIQDSNIEIILSDGGSTDLTLNIIKKYCLNNKNIKLISGNNNDNNNNNFI